MPKKKYKFRLFSAVLATVCIILVGDAVAPTAAIGNSMYVWWAIMLIGFFVPYALISAELGTQYPSEGGMYTWIKKAFGKKWAGRVAWFYWVNYPLWIASLADLITTMIMQMFGIEMEMWMVLAIQIFYIFLVTILGMLRISQSDWVSNIGAIIKILLLSGIGFLGLYVLFSKGTANPVEGWQDFVPLASADGGIDWAGLSFVSLIIFNMLGFEVVGTFYDDMDKPKKQIPKAIILGGILIAIFYIFPSFGMGVGTPFEEIQTNTGFLDSYTVLMANAGFEAAAIQSILVVVGGLFILTLISNVSSWNFGVYSVIACAAEDGMFPKSWKKRNKDGVPYMVGIWTGIVATILAVAGIIIAYVFPEMEELSNMFWAFFSLSLVCLLLSYIPMFAAFIKLHKQGQQVKNGYWLKIGPVLRWVMGVVPLILLFVSLFFTLIPELSLEAILDNYILIISTVICIGIGEIMVFHMSQKDKQKKLARKKKTALKSGR
ncbi:APC family permease [Candidatus Nanosyncoccus alces]|uniref:Inner membrane transporter YcaM n=1 Tax=Candidatus Nanosyncoccus alces TaxID=2171997 RepID=A0ABY0FMG9_9BACT|nr:APC family permease [Candidatus Nanosyncoccus alces]RYC75118.1 Inner membrane transporter YcaM [Candidatus Nanosyncoccus alces]